MSSLQRQYLSIAFRPGGKTYVYHNDGDAMLPGDEVKVPDPRGEPGDWLRAHVVEILINKPDLATKAIVGRLPIADAANEPRP